MTLVITAPVVDRIVEHCRREWPLEACGMVAGLKSNRLPMRVVEMYNDEQSVCYYAFEAGEQLFEYGEMDRRGEDPIVIYHSHTHGEPVPSETDIQLAGEPDAHYLIVGLVESSGLPELRSWRIRDGQATEEPLRVIP